MFSSRISLLKTALFEILEVSRPQYKYARPSRYFDIFILCLIMLNVCAVMLDTISSLNPGLSSFLYVFEIFSVAVFTIEYLIRLWVCDVNVKHPVGKAWILSKIQSKLSFALSIWGIIDLIAVLPFYLPLFINFDLRFIRILRLLRILRVLKAGRYAKSIRSIGSVLKDTKEQLVATLGLMVIVIILSSSIIYYAERSKQPEAFSSIPAALWWGVATLTTVGYGDVYPVTLLGKHCAAMIALAGIGVVALPSGILASGLVEQFQKEQKGETMVENLSNHIVICGWNFLADKIIENLLSEDIRKAGITRIVILSNLSERPEVLNNFDRSIVFVHGDPTKEGSLKKVNIENCHTALVLSDLASGNPDSQALMVALTIQTLNPKIYICAQVHDAENKKHFKNIKVEEIICIEEISAGVSVGSAVNHGLSSLVDELLTFNEGSELYRMNVPQSFVDVSFMDAAKSLLEKSVILIGVMNKSGENPSLSINPNPEHKLSKGESLFVISKERPC